MIEPIPLRTMPRILLVGMMGSGKSTLGRVLAERLGIPALDNDDALRHRAGAGPGSVFEATGEDELHRLEGTLLREQLSAPLAQGEVVNVPASAVLEPDLRRALIRAGHVVWLRARPETLSSRLSGSGLAGRPEYAADMPRWLADRAREREALYAEVAQVTVDVDETPPWRVAQQILDHLGLAAFGWLPGSFAGVVLDLDGLLVDTEVIWEEAKRRLYADHGQAFSMDDHRAVLGTSEEYTAEVFARRFGFGKERYDEVRREYLAHATALFAEGVTTRPGALELVTSLRGRVPLALASNTRRTIVDQTLEQAGLSGCFDATITGDEADPKPAPGIYREACRLIGAAPERCVAVEDSPAGVRSAKAARMTCIGVPSDPVQLLGQADAVRGSLLELIEPGRAPAA